MPRAIVPYTDNRRVHDKDAPMNMQRIYTFTVVATLVLAGCSSTVQPSHAEFIDSNNPHPLFTPMPASDLPQEYRSQLVDAITTHATSLFHPMAPSGEEAFRDQICHGTAPQMQEAMDYMIGQGGVFKLPANVHVHAVGPLNSNSPFYYVVTDDGFVGSTCGSAIRAPA